MANIYVRSTDGSDADNGTTWALAKATLAGAAAIDAAGDTIYLSQNHAESTASALTLAFAGTAANPTKLICGDDAAEPPTSVATTATVTTTGTSGISTTGSFYARGITWNCGTGASAAHISFGNGGYNQAQILDSCTLALLTSNHNSRITNASDATGAVPSESVWNNCNVSFSATGQGVGCGNVNFKWIGGAIAAGSTAISTALVRAPSGTNRSSQVLIDDVDLSGMASTCAIFDGAAALTSAIIKNSKLPTSWSGNLVTGTIQPGPRYEMHNCDAGATNYRLWIEDYAGSIKQETTIVRTGGASDGTTSQSRKMTTSANASYPTMPLESPPISVWNETTGTSLTVSVEIVHDSQGAGTGGAFLNDEIWLEVDYLGSAAAPLGTLKTNCKADVLATAADQPTSTETWTTTGLTSPVKQKLSVTLSSPTPNMKGYIQARVMLAKASKTVYYDHKLTVA